ncbi:hypothetical protein K449DRAFT_429812 [Hypoxylon sp. EC38]|nr:hypothetical protein K449DRAFT_429812 [Hypoxylon sp. EC38]
MLSLPLPRNHSYHTAFLGAIDSHFFMYLNLNTSFWADPYESLTRSLQVRVGDSPGSYRPRLHQSVVSAARHLSWVRLGFARTPLKRRGARNAGCRKGGRNEELTSHFSVEMPSCLYFGAKSGTNGQVTTRTSHLQNIVGVRHPVVPSASTIFSQISKVWTSGKDRIEDTAHSEPGAVKAYGFSFENYGERVDEG